MDLWNMERQLWLEGAEAYATLMAGECLMVFGPMGVLRNAEIPASLRQAPRWADVDMADQIQISPNADTAVIAYRATGRRSGSAPYKALCSST
ncbi:hypothetical protein [Devosia sp. CAU 1758]